MTAIRAGAVSPCTPAPITPELYNREQSSIVPDGNASRGAIHRTEISVSIATTQSARAAYAPTIHCAMANAQPALEDSHSGSAGSSSPVVAPTSPCVHEARTGISERPVACPGRRACTSAAPAGTLTSRFASQHSPQSDSAPTQGDASKDSAVGGTRHHLRGGSAAQPRGAGESPACSAMRSRW